MNRFLLLVLPCAIAMAQLTLLFRAGQGAGDFQVISVLVWFCGLVLWFECSEDFRRPCWRRTAALSLVPIVWSLLVLSRPFTVYDPLINAVPLATLLGLAWLIPLGLFRRFVLLGLLPLLHYALIGLIATEPLEALTASVAGFLLWLGGQNVVAAGNQLLLSDRVVEVAVGCTSLNAQSLGLATVIALLALNGPLRRSRLCLLLLFSPLLAFLLNAVRIMVLAVATTSPHLNAQQTIQGFDFWHTGSGSNLFSLALVLLLFLAEHLIRSAPES